MIQGSIGIAIALTIVTAINATVPPDGPHPNKDAQKAGIAMIFASSIIFSLSYGPISWVYVSEGDRYLYVMHRASPLTNDHITVFPMRVRSMGNEAATCSNWVFNGEQCDCSPYDIIVQFCWCLVIWAQAAPPACAPRIKNIVYFPHLTRLVFAGWRHPSGNSTYCISF